MTIPKSNNVDCPLENEKDKEWKGQPFHRFNVVWQMRSQRRMETPPNVKCL